MKKTVLCFGDSNTWGCVADYVETGMPSARYDNGTRWPRVLAGELGEGYEVIEEGLCGRTSIYTDPDALSEVVDALEAKGYTFTSAEVAMVPQNTIKLTDEGDIKNMEKMIDMLEADDDVQNVWHNWEQE